MAEIAVAGRQPTLDQALHTVAGCVADCKRTYQILKDSIRKADDDDRVYRPVSELVRSSLRTSFDRVRPVLELNLETLERHGVLESPVTIERTFWSANGLCLDLIVIVRAAICAIDDETSLQDALTEKTNLERYFEWVAPGRETVDAIEWFQGRLTDERRALSEAGVLPRVTKSLSADQVKILEALDGQALRVEDLASAVGLNSASDLHKCERLMQLKADGRVRLERPLGYIRPDAPPPELVLKKRRNGAGGKNR